MPGLVELQPSDLLAHGLPGGASAAASWVRSLRAFHAAAHLAHPEAQGQQQQATFTVWRAVSKDLLRPPPEHPFELHQLLYDAVYDAWDVSVLGPRPVWIPTAEVRRARLSACVQRFCICWEALASAVCSEYYLKPGGRTLGFTSGFTRCGSRVGMRLRHAFRPVRISQPRTRGSV